MRIFGARNKDIPSLFRRVFLLFFLAWIAIFVFQDIQRFSGKFIFPSEKKEGEMAERDRETFTIVNLAQEAKLKIPRGSSVLFVSQEIFPYIKFNFWAYPVTAKYSEVKDLEQFSEYDFLIFYESVEETEIVRSEDYVD